MGIEGRMPNQEIVYKLWVMCSSTFKALCINKEVN